MKQILLLFTALCISIAASAADTFVYHGALSQASGEVLTPAQRLVNLTFTLYVQPQAEEGETYLWKESYANVQCDSEGNFIVVIGEGTNNEGGDFSKHLESSTDTLYLGITVGDTQELTPRQALLTVPMAHQAAAARLSLGDFKVQGSASSHKVAADTLETTALGFDTSMPEGSANVTAASVTFAGKVSVNGNAAFSKSSSAEHGISAGAVTGYGAAIKGMIVPWVPSADTTEPPAGWKFCDGQEGRPNLNNTFIAGAKPGDEKFDIETGLTPTRGANSVVLSAGHLPKHQHAFYTPLPKDLMNYLGTSNDSDQYWVNWDSSSFSYTTKAETTFDASDSDRVKDGKASPAGHENRPPFRAVYFIIYVGE